MTQLEIKTTEEIWDEMSDLNDEYAKAINKGMEQKEFDKLVEKRWKKLEEKWVTIENMLMFMSEILPKDSSEDLTIFYFKLREELER